MSSLVNLIKALRENVNDSRDDGFSDTTQALLASAIAFALPLPATIEGFAKSYYTNNLLTQVRRTVSEINELYLLDTEYVIGLVQDTYIVRYNFVHAPELSIDACNAVTQHLVETRSEHNAAPTITPSELRRVQLTVNELLKQV